MSRSVIQQLQVWFSDLTASALASWNVFGDLRCARGRCPNRAVTSCVVCDEPICVEHGYLSQKARMICISCVNAMKGEAAHDDRGPRQRRGFSGDGFEENEHDERVECLRVLGLKKNATWSEIHARFRELSRKYHPDRQAGKSDKARRNAEKKFKRITDAYHRLERIMRSAA